MFLPERVKSSHVERLKNTNSKLPGQPVENLGKQEQNQSATHPDKQAGVSHMTGKHISYDGMYIVMVVYLRFVLSVGDVKVICGRLRFADVNCI